MSGPDGPAQRGQDFEQTLGESDGSVASFETEAKTFLDKAQHFLHGNPTMVPVIVLLVSVLIFSMPFVTDGKFLTAFNLLYKRVASLSATAV